MVQRNYYLMTENEKLIIPLISNCITQNDVSEDSGFIGFYTGDRDKPGNIDFYLAYDDTVRNESSIDRARRFNDCQDIKHRQIKTINGKPIVVYTFWRKPLLKDIHRCFKLTPDVKVRILQFWNFNKEVVSSIFNTKYCQIQNTYLPAADYRPFFTEKFGLAA